MWLVETKVFLKINLLFLVKRHTKSACDRIFNSIKKGHHARNACAYDELAPTVNERECIDVDRTSKEDFYDFLE